MRLDTAEKRAAYRASMIPPAAVRDSRSSDSGEVWTWETLGKPYAIAFWGAAGKPTWYYCFRTDERRQANIAEFFASIASHVAYKESLKLSKTEPHNAKVGDIFSTCWGYDQTNVEYYQITALIGSTMAEVREICAQSEETGFMAGKCVPVPNSFTTEADYSDEGRAYKAEHGAFPRVPKKPYRVKLTMRNGCVTFSVDGHHASYDKPVATIERRQIFKESHWTAYA